MDKYTVDLDKLLNDFEYNELTDTEDDAVVSKPCSDNGEHNRRLNNQLPTTSLNLENTNKKHSITNVFHSLNEYLNTDISNIPMKLDSIYINNVMSNECITPDTSTQIVTSDADKCDTVDDSKVQAENCADIQTQMLKEQPLEHIDNVSSTRDDDKIIEPDTNINLKVLANECDDKRLVEELNIIDCNLKPAVETNAETRIDKKMLESTEQANFVEQIIENNDKIATGFDTKPNEAIQIKPITFDSIVIDESDLDKVLEEIENEYDDNQRIETTEVNSNVCANVQSNVEIADHLDNKSNGRPDKLEEKVANKQTVCVVENKDEDEVKSAQIADSYMKNNIKSIDQSKMEIVCEKPDESRVPENEPEQRETVEAVMEEMTSPKCESSVKENDSERTDEVTEKTEESEDVDVKQDSMEECANVDVDKASNQTESESINNGDRPTSLDLETNESKREIDLIGSPGSTPYNNVYLNKEESSGSDVTSTTLTDSEDSACIESDDSESVVQNKEKVKSKMKTKTKTDGPADKSNPTNKPNDNGESTEPGDWLGKSPPFWMPDSQAPNCLQCDINFTFIKRRHHCRACGLVLCSKCCNMKHFLQYLDIEARVCQKCYNILSQNNEGNTDDASAGTSTANNNNNNNVVQPKPNNPMEYCSVLPPHQQVTNSSAVPPSVMVPVGVLKRKGSAKSKSNKSVMFCDGIRPGSDLTNLDADFNYAQQTASNSQQQQQKVQNKHHGKSFPTLEHETKSFIPALEDGLPPTVNMYKSEITYSECENSAGIVETLKNEMLTFAVNKNLLVHVKIIKMNCCINKIAWCFTTEGLIAVGQDEIVYLIELVEDEKLVPKDVFYHINNIYCDAVKGTTVTELGLSLHNKSIFLNSKNHSGFLYIRPTLQCLQNVILPSEPYLVGLLIHRWECPWAKIFPLRLILRLGAEYRYYPCPIISTRDRDSVFVEIGHTIINLLADFKNFSYTIPNIRGLTIHMEDKNTTVTIPSNRYDQVMKTLNNSSDHILAFGGNFSTEADSHLVCIQDTQSSTENNYTTHAININNKPRKITGASFIVFNGALKSSSGLTAKSSIVEDGLMIQIPPEHMVKVRDCLKNMKNHTIQCGCINAVSDELVMIEWGDPDSNFNIGVSSAIDKQSLSGVPSIRVHNGKDYACHSGSRVIRWTEVFILQNGDELAKAQQDPVDISKVAENVSKATCSALVKYLDLLASNNFYKIGIRATLQTDNVSYSAGSNGIKLPPIYMKSLDNELIPVLHRITANNVTDNAIILELVFRILTL